MTANDLKKGVILYDRSRSTTDWTCARKRYWNYEFDGKGVSPDAEHIALFLGTTFHDGAAVIATQWQAEGEADIDSIAEAARKQVYDTLLSQSDGVDTFGDIEFANEQAALSEGLLRAFYASVWPALMAEYDIESIEQEYLYEHDINGKPQTGGMFRFMVRPDLLLRDKDGNLVYYEYKTTSSKRDAWANSWTTAVQLHSTVRAIEQSTGTAPLGVIVQGVYKGYESYGKQSSPFCYAYKRNGNPPFYRDELAYEYKPGFKRSPVWELQGGSKQWVAGMPHDILGEQFPRTPLIFVNDQLVDQFFKQRAAREFEIKYLAAANHDLVFPQRFDQCTPSFGSPCAYRRLCHGQGDQNPLERGYTYRTPHHLPEIEAWTAQSVTSVEDSPTNAPSTDISE